MTLTTLCKRELSMHTTYDFVHHLFCINTFTLLFAQPILYIGLYDISGSHLGEEFENFQGKFNNNKIFLNVIFERSNQFKIIFCITVCMGEWQYLLWWHVIFGFFATLQLYSQWLNYSFLDFLISKFSSSQDI